MKNFIDEVTKIDDTPLISSLKIISSPIGRNILKSFKNGPVKTKTFINGEAGERNSYIILNKLVISKLVKKNNVGSREKTYELTHAGKEVLKILDFLSDLSENIELVNTIDPFNVHGVDVQIIPNDDKSAKAAILSHEELGRLMMLKDTQQVMNQFKNISHITKERIRFATRTFDHNILETLCECNKKGIQVNVMLSSKIEMSDFLYVLLGAGKEDINNLNSNDKFEVRLANVGQSIATFDTCYSLLEVPKPEGNDFFFYMSLDCCNIVQELSNAFDAYWEKALKLNLNNVCKVVKDIDILNKI